MKDIVVVDINALQEKVAALFADPANNTKWMDDVERYEPLSGEQGMPGSNSLPQGAAGSNVDVHATLSTLPDRRTKLVSEEEFTFKGFLSWLFGMLARGSIRKAHRKHIEAFKRFAEL